ncbi:MAG: FAD-dependent oxidoreductase, partial [Verrucomicrobiales bacterium]|nr:FAD-dependent oxidoreductase [Verrucomicrobiales bacterium]
MESLAIIGSGIAGLGCAHFLRHHYNITVFEAAAHIGGHSNTRTVSENGHDIAVDTGFMVYNEVTYPLLTKLFKSLDVPTKPTSMSFSVHHGPSNTEWEGSGLSGLFAQRKNLLSPSHWRFLSQLNRFNKQAVEAIDDPQWNGLTIADYVARRGYGDTFLHRYLVPMSAAVWSTPPDRMLQFPAKTLLRFWHNHGFLGLHTQHPWRTVDGGAREYVSRLTRPFAAQIHTRTPVRSVRRFSSHVEVVTDTSTSAFDRVILASHADHSLAMLDSPTGPERELLSPFAYQPNKVHLHSDPAIMPATRRAWASWNYRTESAAENTTHYWMNNLQGVSDKRDYFVSLNAGHRIGDQLTHEELDYDHPLFDLPAINAQARLPQLNETTANNRTFFAGSYFRNGFHEDALRSAHDLAKTILGTDPWEA